MIQILSVFLISIVCVFSARAQGNKPSKSETVVSMDGSEVHRIKNPTSLKSLNKEKYKAQSNDLLVDLTINLQDHGIKKNVVGCVDEMIQKSKSDSSLNTYSVEALGLICANYERQDRPEQNGITHYFNGGFILHEGSSKEKPEGLLIINGAENKTESIAALKGLPVDKIDTTIEKSDLDVKYCTSTSGYTSAACEQIGCGTFKVQVSRRVSTERSYEFTSCQNATCKGFSGDKFRTEIIGTTDYDEGNEKIKKFLKLFGETYRKYKLGEPVPKEACIPCPSNYSFDGLNCIDENGCTLHEKFENGVCIFEPCEYERALGMSCINSCKSDCERRIEHIERKIRDPSSTQLSDLFWIAIQSTNEQSDMEEWEKKNFKEAAKLKIQLLAAAENYLQKLKKSKNCSREECSFSREMLDIINSYNFCGNGNSYTRFAECKKSQCVKCEEAAASLNLYKQSSYKSVKCGSNSDQDQIYAFLFQNAEVEYRERSILCDKGRVDICKEFVPIKEQDVRNIAQRIGINCSKSSTSPSQGRK